MSLLADQVAVITGGGRGIGAAIARRFAAEGARVVVAGRSEAQLQALCDDLHESGGRASYAVCDVTVPAQVTALRDHVREVAGRCSVLVNNAGIAKSAKLQDTDEALWALHMDVNLNGAYRVTRAFLDDVLAAGKRGRIVNVASVAAKIGWAYTSAYCASKHGLLGLTRALAVEVARKGTTVNCVCPGWVDTDMADDAAVNIARTTGRAKEDARKALEQMSPQNRLMTAEEVAEVTLFLASAAAGGVTGQGWNVDGGGVVY